MDYDVLTTIGDATMALHVTQSGASIGSFMNEMAHFLGEKSTWYQAEYLATLTDDGRRLVRQLAAAIEQEEAAHG